MKFTLKRSLLACAVTLACTAGCAKQQVIKHDQMIPPAAPAAKAPAKPAQAEVKAPVKESAIPASSIAQADAVKADAAQKAPSLKDALQKVYFNFDSSSLSADARQTLAKNADLLKQNAGSKIRIEGNCDEMGSDDYNLALGERRAKAAKEYLQNLGVPAERLSTISYGKEKPAAQGHDEAARAKNRRDEFVVSSN